MRFCDSKYIERIGFDFYCDISNNIVKARAVLFVCGNSNYRIFSEDSQYILVIFSELIIQEVRF